MSWWDLPRLEPELGAGLEVGAGGGVGSREQADSTVL